MSEITITEEESMEYKCRTIKLSEGGYLMVATLRYRELEGGNYGSYVWALYDRPHLVNAGSGGSIQGKDRAELLEEFQADAERYFKYLCESWDKSLEYEREGK